MRFSPRTPSVSTSQGRLWLFGISIATVFGGLSVLLLKVGLGLVGRSLTWTQALAGLPDWYVWALLVPLVVTLARAFPLDHERWGASLAVHIPLGLGVALLELTVFTGVNVWYNRAFLDPADPSFLATYVAVVARWLPLALLIYALIVAIVTAVDHARSAREGAIAAARLETELVRAKAQALQSQIQPHFLFNTLNSIATLVREGRRDEAVDAMAALGGLLRSSIKLSDRVEISLRQELGLIEDYLRLEQYRMADRLKVHYEIDPHALPARVPNMLLQPLVENAVIHGLASQTTGGVIRVTATRFNGHLDLSVHDTGCGFAGVPAEGIGLRNVRERLRAHHGDSASMAIESSPGHGTQVGIRLPFLRSVESS